MRVITTFQHKNPATKAMETWCCCPECGQKVKAANLRMHLFQQHRGTGKIRFDFEPVREKPLREKPPKTKRPLYEVEAHSPTKPKPHSDGKRRAECASVRTPRGRR